jgi:hypothetical protein
MNGVSEAPDEGRRGLRSLPRGRLLAAILAATLVLAGVLLATLGGRGRGSLLPSPAHADQVRSSQRIGEVRAAARLFGVSAPLLRRELRAGRSLAEAAAAHGVPVSALVQRLLAYRRATLPAGTHLDASRRAARLDRLRRSVEASVNRHGAPPGAVNVAVAARYLGLRIPDLRARLSEGRTLAQLVAGAQGRSVAGLVAALAAAHRAALAREVARGGITRAQQQRALATLTSTIEAIVRRAPLSTGSGA